MESDTGKRETLKRINSSICIQHCLDRGYINYRFFLEIDPKMESLRDDDRFKALMAEMKERWDRFDL